MVYLKDILDRLYSEIGNLKRIISEPKVAEVYTHKGRVTCTTKYTIAEGFEYTVPANRSFTVRASMTYNNSRPTNVTVEGNDGNLYARSAQDNNSSPYVGCVVATGAGKAGNDPLKLIVKYTTAGDSSYLNDVFFQVMILPN